MSHTRQPRRASHAPPESTTWRCAAHQRARAHPLLAPSGRAKVSRRLRRAPPVPARPRLCARPAKRPRASETRLPSATTLLAAVGHGRGCSAGDFTDSDVTPGRRNGDASRRCLTAPPASPSKAAPSPRRPPWGCRCRPSTREAKATATPGKPARVSRRMGDSRAGTASRDSTGSGAPAPFRGELGGGRVASRGRARLRSRLRSDARSLRGVRRRHGELRRHTQC